MATKPIEKKKVLLVDDDQRILNFMRVKLIACGYEVSTALNGDDALEAMVPLTPDILILDVLMPGKGGLEVLKEVKARRGPPVLIMSAENSFAVQALSMGASGFIAKPFDPDGLVARVADALNDWPRSRWTCDKN
jgi:DNA-binding response OmpR family regulator